MCRRDSAYLSITQIRRYSKEMHRTSENYSVESGVFDTAKQERAYGKQNRKVPPPSCAHPKDTIGKDPDIFHKQLPTDTRESGPISKVKCKETVEDHIRTNRCLMKNSYTVIYHVTSHWGSICSTSALLPGKAKMTREKRCNGRSLWVT